MTQASLFTMNPATATMIAEELGVTLNRVSMWHQRRERNGFPESIGRMEIGEGRSHRREARVWDLDAVKDWYKNYVPDPGGRRPKARG